jgi:hypothetical protein
MRYLLTLPVQCRPAQMTFHGLLYVGHTPSEPLARVDTDGRVEMFETADEQKVIVMLREVYDVTDEMLKQVGYGA